MLLKQAQSLPNHHSQCSSRAHAGQHMRSNLLSCCFSLLLQAFHKGAAPAEPSSRTSSQADTAADQLEAQQYCMAQLHMAELVLLQCSAFPKEHCCVHKPAKGSLAGEALLAGLPCSSQ
jgi:hypothetical protein